MRDWDPNDFPLPDWATKRASGSYLEEGAQLATRDGRRCGNAYVDRVDALGEEGVGRIVALVFTDMGSRMVLNESELRELFHPPAYIMDRDEAAKRRNVNDELRELFLKGL